MRQRKRAKKDVDEGDVDAVEMQKMLVPSAPPFEIHNDNDEPGNYAVAQQTPSRNQGGVTQHLPFLMDQKSCSSREMLNLLCLSILNDRI